MTTDTSRYYSYLADYDRVVAFNNRIRKRVRRKVNKTSVGKEYLSAKRRFYFIKFLIASFPILIRGLFLMLAIAGLTYWQISFWSNSSFEMAAGDIFMSVTAGLAIVFLTVGGVFGGILCLDEHNKIFLSEELSEKLDSHYGAVWGIFFAIDLGIGIVGLFFFYKWWEALLLIILLPIALVLYIIFAIFNIKGTRAPFLKAFFPLLGFTGLGILIAGIDFLVGQWMSKLQKAWKETDSFKKEEDKFDAQYEQYMEEIDKRLENEPLKDEASAWGKVRQASREVDWDAVRALEKQEKIRKENEKFMERVEQHNKRMERYADERERQSREAIGQLEKANRQRDNISADLERWRNQ